MLALALALALHPGLIGPAAPQEPPLIYPVSDDSGPVLVRGADGQEQQWMVTRLVDRATRAALRGRIAAYVEHMQPEPATWAPLRSAESDAEGWVRLRVDDLLEQRGLWLVAEAEGYAPSAEMTPFPSLPWELERGMDIPLQVLDAFGRPIVGARVGWHLGCGHTADVRQVVTDAEGLALLRCASGDYGEIWIVAPNVRGEYRDLGAWRTGRGVRVLHCDPAPTHRGVVVDADGKPRAGVHVGISEYHRGPWCLTDAEGRFALDGADSTELNVIDERTGTDHWFAVPPQGLEARFVLPKPGEDRAEPELPDEPNVRLRAELPPGRHREGVPVVAWCGARGYRAEELIELGEELAVAWPAGSYELVFGGGRGDWCERRAALVVPREGAVELAVAMTPRPRVRMWMDATSAFAALLPKHGSLELVTATWQRSIEEEVLEGRAIAVPENEPWAVRARLYDRARSISGSLVDERGELEIPPLEPHRVRLRFVDATGRPVAGRARIAKHPTGQLEYEGEAAWSARAEHVELSSWLGAGRWLLIVESAEDAWRAPRPISELELPPKTSAVLDLGAIALVPAHHRGFTLRRPDGAPAAGVELRWDDENIALDEEGRLPSGTFAGPGDRVEVDLEDGLTVPFAQTLEGSGPWELRWPAGELQLEVRDASGEPLPRFAVHLDGTTYEGVEGALALRGLATGERELLIAAQGFVPQRTTLDLAPQASAKLRLQPR
ncbi:MAG: carboxypeptidase regulatory-like domain-containing protein [Planctomycetes bacterium]|nr:carboxypeptidase regulatory-like domain-containing protein [Planctomycetota bacterium]